MASTGREEVLNSERAFTGKLLKVRVDTVMLPNGRLARREVVEHRGAVAVVALADGGIVLEKQYRHAAGKVVWEIPAGTLEEGEEPASAAARELEEETGYVPGKLEPLSHFFVAVGYSTEVIHLFLATGLGMRATRQDDDEHIETAIIPLEEAIRMMASNTIEDAKTIIGLMTAKNRIGVR